MKALATNINDIAKGLLFTFYKITDIINLKNFK